MNIEHPWKPHERLIFCAGLILILVVNGAVPFLLTPTLGQAVWTAGFAQSFANGPIYNIYAHDFGNPAPAFIAFGLAGAFPVDLFIRLGLRASDAYAAMVACWLTIAFYSAVRLSLAFGTTRIISVLGAATWVTLPIVTAHAGYSMLSLGIALLPFYFLATLRIFLLIPEQKTLILSDAIFYVAAMTISVFMDGYTFVMVAVGSGILFLYAIYVNRANRSFLLRMSLPLYLGGLIFAYGLYTFYIGKWSFESHSIDTFRAWGTDLSFLFIPTKGMHWLPDLLGLSVKRSDQTFFGDASVWRTTFSLPIILLGIFAWIKARHLTPFISCLMILAFVGFYMSLGPSLKIMSTKPQVDQGGITEPLGPAMPKEYALGPTGTAWLSKHVPGLKVMRSAYRWTALKVFALWLAVMICAGLKVFQVSPLWALGLSSVFVLNLPNPYKTVMLKLQHREMFYQIDSDLVASLQHHVKAGSRVLFVPWGNDFFVNYLAPRSGFRTFNIGGDKNLAAAQASWPQEVLALSGPVQADQIPNMVRLLANDTADKIIIPYFDLLWAAHTWPCPEQSIIFSDVSSLGHTPLPSCTDQIRGQLAGVVTELRKRPYFEVVDTPLYALVSLRPEYMSQVERSKILDELRASVDYPVIFTSQSKTSSLLLDDGWHTLELDRVWSSNRARLILPVPPSRCASANCIATLNFEVFGASQAHPVSITFSTVGPGKNWSETIVSNSASGNHVKIPLMGSTRMEDISISVPQATSPAALSNSSDGRILGIALQSIELTAN